MSATIQAGGKTLYKQPDGTYKSVKPKSSPTQGTNAKVRARALKKQAAEQANRLFTETCLKAGLPNPIAEHKFHPARKWRIDYFFRRGDVKVGLEVEGGVWSKGRHTRGAGFLKDMEKYNAFSEEGIYLVRTTPTNLFTQGIRDVLRVFENRKQ